MSKFFKGFGIGAGLIATAGIVGAGYVAAKKIKESDKRIDEFIKESISKKKKVCTCSCVNEENCSCEKMVDELSNNENIFEDTTEESEVFESFNDITEDDYLESVIEERDALKAELENLKGNRSHSKRKKNQ